MFPEPLILKNRYTSALSKYDCTGSLNSYTALPVVVVVTPSAMVPAVSGNHT
jgi:hypothetical protein